MRNVRRQSILEAARRGVWATPSSDASTHSPRVCFVCVCVCQYAAAPGTQSHTHPMCMHPAESSALSPSPPWLPTSLHTHTWLFCFSPSLADQSDSYPYFHIVHLFACRSWIPCSPCVSGSPAMMPFFLLSPRALTALFAPTVCPDKNQILLDAPVLRSFARNRRSSDSLTRPLPAVYPSLPPSQHRRRYDLAVV